ncbi:hypothetical protein HIM_03399 [Hirsutella minnesotensis 3608]|uniref:E3 ubiquitin-protein ligase listerin n=1 Tax=Hirsutella minnesotensis 3608 TaxID=1043627 RepID=A0A0F7ZVR6_9HYPO|nr:hypothetical protein HIM_03399 [Hirsutella minnesotensis 3608]
MKRAQQAKAASRNAFSGTAAGVFGSASTTTSLSYLTEPPSFNAISDPNIVVSLKNTLKKDSTTKAKALDDLLHHVQDHPFDQGAGVDEALLDVWAQLYPRISIDNSRRVRELSHSLQLSLIKSARKRFERYIPKVVGAWLAGLYDRDRLVSRAAEESLSSFLSTPEKVTAFWTKCQSPILDYAIEAAQETQDTLSDGRTTTKEEAEAKYYRVITGSLSLVLGLLQLDPKAIEPSQEKLDTFFAEDVVWKSITFKDPHVRKTTCQLLFMCLERRLPYSDSTKAKQAFITGGLKANHSGSALEYVRALTKLTQSNPSVWAMGAGDKKSPLQRLQTFIAKGSQGSPPKFWECLSQLLAAIPIDKLTLEEASGLLSSLKSGITSRDEARTNTSSSWKCYVDASQRCLPALSADDQMTLARGQLFPLLEQSIFSVAEKQSAIPLGVNALSILCDIQIALVRSSHLLADSVADEWSRLGTLFCQEISGSLPAVSKEFQSSQTKIGEEGRRWFGLVGLMHNKAQELKEDFDNTKTPSTKVVLQCMSLLESRNLKPFGAAQVIEYALSMSPHLFAGDLADRLSAFLLSAAREDMLKMVDAPSSHHLFSCLNLLGTLPGLDVQYRSIWSTWVEAALELPFEGPGGTALARLVSQEKAGPLAKQSSKLQDTIPRYASSMGNQGAKTDGKASTLFEAAVMNEALSDETSRKVAGEMVNLLRTQSQTEVVLRALEILAKKQPRLFASTEAVSTDLVAQLLSLSEVNDDTISSKAERIRSLLDGQGRGALSTVEIIQSNLERAGPQTLDIGTLALQAKRAAGTSAPWEDMFPSTNMWMTELSKILERSLHPSLSITSDIGGAAALCLTDPVAAETKSSRDRYGRSIPARMALYTLQVLSFAPADLDLPLEFHVELLYLQCLSIQVASDQITTAGTDGLWAELAEKTADEAEELVASSRSLLGKFLTDATDWDKATAAGKSKIVRGLVDLTMKEAANLTHRGVYSSRVLSELLQTLTEIHGAPSGLDSDFLKPEYLKTTAETVLVTAGILTGLGETLKSSKAISNLCNRLVSDVAGMSPAKDKSRMTLILLTLCAQIYGSGELPVANNRIVFAVKEVTSWTEDINGLDAGFCADICRALGRLLPCMAEVYGSYWEKSLQFCIALWKHAARYTLSEALPFIHSSLKLYRVLESLEGANDDLQDALKEASSAKCAGLLELLRLPRDETLQPLEIVDAMMCRETERIPISRLPDPSDMYALIASESRDVQTAAFNMLHRKIPVLQDEESIVNLLLDKQDARLPDELLSLLLDPPTLDKFTDDALSLFPLSVRSYLLSWKLIFDAFSTPSFKVKSDLTEHLKTGDYVNPLLDFLTDVLGHSAAHPLNLDKENLGPEQICEYDLALAEAESGEKNMHWLLTHLYFLILKHIPSLFKAWYIDCRSKQTRIAIDSWTVKYFSPLIITDTLDKVQTWAESQEAPASDENELQVKVSKAACEVTAGYEVDESQASIFIKVPADYPIGGVTVGSLNRVAVTERKWQSWIMTTQAVITFSSGSIVDGLQVFRRNVAGALKGQSECAICYSIISADRRMPDKRCATCKNLFHRSCLYKWFQTSNQNTCPLCRNPISFLGNDASRRRRHFDDDDD